MKEPTLFTLPDIPDDKSLVPIARTGIPSKLTKSGLSLSLLLHAVVLAMLLASGINAAKVPHARKSPPLQAYMITSPQIHSLRVVPLAESAAVDNTGHAENESNSSATSPSPKKAALPAPVKEPVVSKGPLTDSSAFDKINERVKRVQAAQKQEGSDNSASIDELVAKLKKGREQRDALFDTISEISTPQKPLELMSTTEAPKDVPEALSSQDAVGSMSMDPLFLYQSQIAEKIRSYIRSSSPLVGECKLSLSLSRDGHVIKISPLRGGKKICAASVKAALRADVFSMPQDNYLYQNLKRLTITVRMDENQNTFPVENPIINTL
ncbi:hypothetical protein BM525_20370 (plasmid) [Alteromonas mediterranea]|uniref:TonB C-terminal domain-containing protein n=1 Tax=Alteromonas mediterranea TaxID=314275 RepID=A0AAC9NSX6_9ALTE|nr:cell envelope integrity protein TolA [Alteromonas mediterranea]APD92235.1 hypothetical protein BM524_20175 [Alteromonas mediterranea]APE00090.1 hypothetical protein BM525_20370 [Alteromonas mediterranea]